MTAAVDLLTGLDRSARTSLHDQLCAALRTAIVAGRLHPGCRLPATRRLAASLHVGRLTVVESYEQMVAEGLVETRPGSGTFVASQAAGGPWRSEPPLRSDVVRP